MHKYIFCPSLFFLLCCSFSKCIFYLLLAVYTNTLKHIFIIVNCVCLVFVIYPHTHKALISSHLIKSEHFRMSQHVSVSLCFVCEYVKWVVCVSPHIFYSLQQLLGICKAKCQGVNFHRDEGVPRARH